MKSSLKQERSAAVNDDEDDEADESISGAGADNKSTSAAVNEGEADEA